MGGNGAAVAASPPIGYGIMVNILVGCQCTADQISGYSAASAHTTGGISMYQAKLFDSYSNSLKELYSSVNSCQGCAYHLTNSTRVNGAGNMNPQVMIIGQGPGPAEIRAGRPYVGSSGKLLRRILKDPKVGINSVYYTNLIRCTQPELKSIMTKAVRMCSPWLEDEVGIVAPRLIVCLGGLATLHILGLDQLSEHIGEVHDSIYGIPGIPMYHTAWILRVRTNDRNNYARISREYMDQWINIGNMVRNDVGSN